MRSGIHIAITVGFSQSTYTASEHDGFIQICAELLEGELGTDISILVVPWVLGNQSGTLKIITKVICCIIYNFIQQPMAWIMLGYQRFFCLYLDSLITLPPVSTYPLLMMLF